MSTGRPQNLQLPLHPRTVLITDVTRLQPFIAGGDSFRENIETLVSYNIRNNGSQQDCLYIEQGHLMTPTTFMTYSMAIDPRKSSCNMDSNMNVLYSAAGLPALISTGITFIYFFLKACCYMFHAISHKTEGRLATAMPGCGEQKHSADTGSQGHTEVCEQVPGNSTEQYGGGTQRSPGSVFVPRRRQDVRLPSRGDAPEHTEESTFRENAKRLQGRRHRNPQDYNGKGPGDPYVNPTGIFTKCGSIDNASDGQSSNDEGNGRKCDREQPDQVFDDGVLGYRTADPTHYATATKTQVTQVALQTDLCDTLYVTKNTLTAYTIAIVQNAQALQYDQMHVALQTVRNQASIETPLRADELMTAHFNLAVLSNETDINKTPDAQKPEATTLDAEPSASNADEETYVKIPSHCYAANCEAKKHHPNV